MTETDDYLPPANYTSQANSMTVDGFEVTPLSYYANLYKVSEAWIIHHTETKNTFQTFRNPRPYLIVDGITYVKKIYDRNLLATLGWHVPAPDKNGVVKVEPTLIEQVKELTAQVKTLIENKGLDGSPVEPSSKSIGPCGGPIDNSMNSKEISQITGRAHRHVLRDIKESLSRLGIDPEIFKKSYQDTKGRTQPLYELPYELVGALAATYDKDNAKKLVEAVGLKTNPKLEHLP